MKTKIMLSFWVMLAGVAAGQPTNDGFANSAQLTGTNFTYSANFDGATMESGEPYNGASNTVWMSWAAPADGFAQVSMASAPQFQYYGIYTGSSVDHLQPVNLVPIGANSIYRFMVSEGMVYHFQFSGGADNFAFNFQFQTWPPCANDNFTNAQVVSGNTIYFPVACVNAATMELGEPAHMGNVPQKSVWWKWQAQAWGSYRINPSGSLASNLVLAVYTGDSVEALTLVGKSTNSTLSFPVTGGQTYYIAGATPSNSVGDIRNYSQYGNQNTSAHVIPGNLLQEPSWEGTALRPVYWGKSAGVGGYVNQPGGADGVTWPTLGSSGGVNAKIWQSFPTIPGHQYAIRFAFALGNGSGDVQVGVIWDNTLLGISVIPDGAGGWYWGNYTAIAAQTTSLITFTNVAHDSKYPAIGRGVQMDAFSVVDMSAPPAIMIQPVSVSSVAGGTANFVVGVTGTSPLSYQWYFTNSPMNGQTSKMLVLNPLTAGQAGDYQVIITNAFGAVTSTIASLLVDAPVSATMLSQPFGETVPAGGYFNFSVVAAGTPPLAYQWFLDNQVVTGATNSNLMLTNVQPTDAGTYTVQVANTSSTVWSLPATLIVSQTDLGGGTIDFRNRNFFSGSTNFNAPVFDLDGTTLLSGTQYVAQLYAGPSLDSLRPAGQAVQAPVLYSLLADEDLKPLLGIWDEVEI